MYYIVAFDCHEPNIDAIDINELLYGRVCNFTPFNPADSSNLKNKIESSASWGIIEKAKNRGWEKLLTEKYLIPNRCCCVDKEGIFISEKEMNNVCGILFRCTGNEIAFYPNPFCDTEINNSKISDFMKYY